MRKEFWFVFITCTIGLVLVGIFGLLAGCGMVERTGEVTISVGSSVAKSLMPNISLEASRYELAGSGPGGASFSATIVGASGSVVKQLFPGAWTFTATVYNSDTVPIAIGSGSGGATVVVGTPTFATVTCAAYSGDGTLVANIEWIPDVIANPSAAIDMVDFLGVSFPLALPLTSSTTASGTRDLPAGWYTGFLTVKDAGVLNAGVARSVRIAKLATTTWAQFLTANALEGTVTIDLRYNPGLALSITVDPVQGGTMIVPGTPQLFEILTVGLDPDTTALHAWYMDGVATALSTTSSYTVSNPGWKDDEVHFLSAVVIQSDGKRMADAQWMVTKFYAANTRNVWGSFPLQTATVANLINADTEAIMRSVATTTTAYDFAGAPFAPGRYRIQLLASPPSPERWWTNDHFFAGTEALSDYFILPHADGESFDF